MNILTFFTMYYIVYETILSYGTDDKLLFKTISSICFLLCGIFSFKKSPKTKKYSLLILIGLFLGLVGDVVLSSPNIKNYFLIGASSFAIGHIFYILAFLSITSFYIRDVIISLIGSYGVYFIFSNILNAGDNIIIFCVYSFIIFFMTLQSLHLFKFRKTNKLFCFLAILGSILFTLSDIVLSFEISLPYPQAFLSMINLSLYYTAQGLIALSLSCTNSLSSSNKSNNTSNK